MNPQGDGTNAFAIAGDRATRDAFRLARSQKAEYNQYFSQAEPVTVKLEEKVYQIDPAPGGATP